LAFATFLVWRLRIGACGVGACGFGAYDSYPTRGLTCTLIIFPLSSYILEIISQEFSRRLVDPVEVREGMEHVPQDAAEIEKCDCLSSKEKPEKSPEKDEL